MKKRWFLTALFALILCACFIPAQASVTTGGQEYFWYVEDGELVYNEGVPVRYQGDRLYLSADQGISYGEVPAFRKESQRRWERYGETARVLPREGGGLVIEALGATPLHLELSDREIARILQKAEATPVRVLATNGNVTVGIREVQDTENGSNWGDPYDGGSRNHLRYDEQLLWSTDGVTWNLSDRQPEEACTSGWWDGAFYLKIREYTSDGYTSPDGVSWTYLEELPISPKLGLTADWGRYHFEVAKPWGDPNDWYNEVYLMEGTERGQGVLLPHMGEGIRANSIGVDSLTAHAGPNDTVILTASGYNGSFSLDYPISSLDWCLENLSYSFRGETQPAAEVSNGEGISLAKVAEHYRNGNTYEMEGELIRYDGTGWRKVENTPFSCVFRLLPFNGKTFLVEDNAAGYHRLYASGDGLAWTEVTALRPQDMRGDVKDYVNYAVTWTGNGYLACQEAGNYGNRAGGTLYGGNTSVYLLDENFSLTGSYDFGRNVQAVGFRDGVCYAQVSDSEGTRWRGVYHVGYDENGKEVYTTDPGYYNKYAPAAIYRSTDGKNWERTELLQTQGVLRNLTEGLAALGTAKREIGPAGSADLGKYHFYLDHEKIDWDPQWGGYRPTVMVTDETGQGGTVPGAGEAIQNAWLTPGLLSVRYDEGGQVELTVRDLFSEDMVATVRCGTKELDQIITDGEALWDELRKEEFRAAHNEETWLALHEVSGNNYTLWENWELVWSQVGGDEGSTYWSNTMDCALGRLHVTRDMPWSGHILLFPYNGKTFLIYDRNSGDFYASENGRDWQKAEAAWINDHRDFFTGRREGSLGYSFVWTGDKYLASCWLYALNNDKWEYEWYQDNTKALFLDEDFQLVGSYDFGRPVSSVGFLNGFYYVRVATRPEDVIRLDTELYRSADGEHWEKAEELNVRSVMVPMG